MPVRGLLFSMLVLAGPVYGELVGFLDTGGSFALFSDPLADPRANSGITYGFGNNDSGQVVGYSIAGAFTYSAGSFTRILIPGSLGVYPNDINDLGQVVGYYGTGGPSVPFVYSAGAVTVIGNPIVGSTQTRPMGINDSGQIVGWYQAGALAFHGFTYNAGAFATLDVPFTATSTSPTGINNAGQIVGYYQDASGYHGFLDSAGVFTTIDDPLTPGATFPEGINSAGQIVGVYGSFGADSHSFLYDHGAFTTIAGPPGTSGLMAYGINDLGQISGTLNVPEPLTLPGILAALVLGRVARLRFPHAAPMAGDLHAMRHAREKSLRDHVSC